jgi:hypothetical protein
MQLDLAQSTDLVNDHIETEALTYENKVHHCAENLYILVFLSLDLWNQKVL